MNVSTSASDSGRVRKSDRADVDGNSQMSLDSRRDSGSVESVQSSVGDQMNTHSYSELDHPDTHHRDDPSGNQHNHRQNQLENQLENHLERRQDGPSDGPDDDPANEPDGSNTAGSAGRSVAAIRDRAGRDRAERHAAERHAAERLVINEYVASRRPPGEQAADRGGADPLASDDRAAGQPVAIRPGGHGCGESEPSQGSQLISSAADHSAPGFAASDEPVLRVENVVKYFDIRRGALLRRKVGEVKAVDDVSFTVRPGETLGIVGETGCGKSTLARTLLRLHEPTSGRAYFKGRDLFAMSSSELRRTRRDIQMIFQDPFTSLNPRMTVCDIVTEAWQVHRHSLPKKQRLDRAGELLELVGLNPDHGSRYPHQFSGGQRQRVGVARAIALNPSVIICDEPVSALDMSVQAQVLNLLEDLQRELNLAYVVIAHDLSVVRHISDRVAVMYLGQIVEEGTAAELYGSPLHPYTQALLSAVPSTEMGRDRGADRILLEGDVPSPADPPSGCRFRTRCWKATERCALESPALEDRGFGHPAACFYPDVSPGPLAPTRSSLKRPVDVTWGGTMVEPF